MDDEVLDADQGKLYSEKFKQVLLSHDLKFDRTCTGDIARVLRVPGTLNYKQMPARRVKLKLLSDDSGQPTLFRHACTELCTKIDALYAAAALPEQAPPPDLLLGAIPEHLRNVKLDKETEALITTKPKSFKVLMKKCARGEGCAQITNIVGDQQGQDEPRWRAGLSVAYFCEDGADAIHNMSNRHPGYSHAETEKKVVGLVGPFKCSTFEANWPQLCQNCAHKGKITSPIQLGDFVPLADKKDNIVLGRNKSVDDSEIAYTIPEYPFPYVRGKNGGVYRRNPEDEDNPSEVVKFDMYVLDRMRHPQGGYMLALRLHHPTDGVIDFTVDAADVGSKENFRSILNNFGVMKVDGGVAMVRQYVVRWLEDLELKKAASMVRTQMGWTEGFKSFVIGDREITAGGKTYSRTAPSLAPVTAALTKAGDMAEWRKTFNIYAMPGFESYALCALVGFGAPLMPLLDREGCVINAYAQDSGTGKTTTQHAALSIWGKPKGLILTCGEKGDTINAHFNRMGQYKNLPICIDEATELKYEDIKGMLLATTMGRAKHRMSGSANTERANDSNWSTLSLYSANTSFVDILQAEGGAMEGPLMRIMEVHLPKHNLLTKEQSEAHFGAFHHHYGHAGEHYVQHLLRNFMRILPMLEEERRRIDALAGVGNDNSERYWSAAVACIMTGGRMAQEAGLHDINMDSIRNTCADLIKRTRARHQFKNVLVDRNSDILAEFINMNVPNTVVVQVGQMNGKPVVTPLREVSHREMYARLEKNDGTLYITRTALNEFLRKRSIVVQNFLDDMKDKGVLLDESRQMHLGQGTVNKGGNVRCYVFKMPVDELPPLVD
jgi:hypothetical protein